jgi:hypothetical protein
MSLTALPVTSSDLTTLQQGITFTANATDAVNQAAAINAPGSTVSVFTYAANLLNANVSLSQVAMGLFPFMTGVTDTTAHIGAITTQFLPAQVASKGFNVTVFAAEAYGSALSTNAAFNASFVTPFANNPAGFAAAVSTATGVSAAAILQFVSNWTQFFTQHPEALQGRTVTQAAFGSAFGDAYGTALVTPGLSSNIATVISTNPAFPFSPNTVQGIVANALIDNAEGLYKAGVALGALPPHQLLQGEAGVPVGTLILTPGVDTPTQGFTTGKGATATQAGSIFVALPASNPPLGVTNTLNAGDDLETTDAAVGNTTLNFTAIDSIINPPFAPAVTMNGVSTAVITSNTAAAVAGFAGNITGLTQVAATSNNLAPIQVGTAADGLNTALTQISLQSGMIFTAWMTAAALGGAADAATVNVFGVAATANLDVTAGTNGYETLTVSSIGPANSPNTLTLNTNATSTATINATGSQNFTLNGTALNIANLHTFNGSAATGTEHVIFSGAGNVKATGGSNNDTFTFTSLGSATFTSASSVDGGGGTNELEIQANNGALLGAGVGPNITNIQVVEHIGGLANPGVTLTVDMSRSGSANTLELAGDYSTGAVEVSNLTNAKTVVFEGFDLGSLMLAHATPLGLLDVINFTVARSAETPGPAGNLVLNSLFVGPGLAALNVNSTGTAPDNVINKVFPVKDDVIITGGTHLTFGVGLGGYGLEGGTIDARTDTGGVETTLALIAAATKTQTFLGGPGNDTVHVLNFFHTTIDFSTGGSDIVNFTNAFFNGGGPLANNPGFSYNTVLGFAEANDRIDLTNSPFLGDIAFTNDGVVGAVGASTILQFTTNTLVNASALPDNWIKIVTPTSGAGLTAAQGMAESIGLLGAIQVSAGHNYLVSYYDLTDSQAVFATIDSAAGGAPTFITAGDATNAGVHVIGLIGMSQDDYAALAANNLHFV